MLCNSSCFHCRGYEVFSSTKVYMRSYIMRQFPKCSVEQQLPAIDMEMFILCKSLILSAQAIGSHICLSL